MSPVVLFCVARTLSTSMLISLLVAVPGAPSSAVLFASLALANSNVVVTGAPSKPPVVSPYAPLVSSIFSLSKSCNP